MRDFRIDNKGTTRLFNNRILEKLTRTHFLTPVLLYYFITVVCVTYAVVYANLEIWKLIYMFPLGFLVFTLVEYLIHRYIFHFSPSNEHQEQIQYSIHGVHHEFPKDKDRLVMPPVLSIVVAALFFGLFALISGSYVWLFFPGFSSGYATYLIIHYAVHRYRPPSNFLKYLWKHHSLHHYNSTEQAFSVSFPFWDMVFGTMPDYSKQKNNREADRLPDLHS